MSLRREFLGFLGNVCLAGGVVRKEGISRPTLAMPLWLPPVLTEVPPAPHPRRHPLLTAAGDQANAMMQIRAGLPDDPFLDFLEGGLREARFYKGRSEATIDGIAEAALNEHGSIIAAMRAGAL